MSDSTHTVTVRAFDSAYPGSMFDKPHGEYVERGDASSLAAALLELVAKHKRDAEDFEDALKQEKAERDALRAMVQIAYTGLNHHDQVAMTKEVYGDRRTYGPGEETTANARLISAAPDLLEALIAAEQALEHAGSHLHADRCREVIAKATGAAA